MADTALTISSTRVSPLSDEERAATGYSYKATIKSSDFASVSTSGATDTVTFTLGATPANWYIDKALLKVGTAFAGITALTAQVGTTSSTAALVSATSILTAGVIHEVSTVPILTNTTGTATVNLVAILTAAGTGGPAGVTAGQCTLYLNLVDVDRMP